MIRLQHSSAQSEALYTETGLSGYIATTILVYNSIIYTEPSQRPVDDGCCLVKSFFPSSIQRDWSNDDLIDYGSSAEASTTNYSCIKSFPFCAYSDLLLIVTHMLQFHHPYPAEKMHD